MVLLNLKSTICDDIAYNNNDIDDGLYANFLKLKS